MTILTKNHVRRRVANTRDEENLHDLENKIPCLSLQFNLRKRRTPRKSRCNYNEVSNQSQSVTIAVSYIYRESEPGLLVRR